jgi:hypothetical protein
MDQETEYLPRQHEALSSNPNCPLKKECYIAALLKKKKVKI